MVPHHPQGQLQAQLQGEAGRIGGEKHWGMREEKHWGTIHPCRSPSPVSPPSPAFPAAAAPPHHHPGPGPRPWTGSY